MKLGKSLLVTLLLVLSPLGCAVAQTGDAEPPAYSNAQLDQMLAPIALYPDTVLSHVLIAATYPLEVVRAARWSREHSGLSGQAAVDAAARKNWDPSVQALVAFPELLDRMSRDLDWTERLGAAFLTDEERVLDRVQVLRRHAYDNGHLDNLRYLSANRQRQQIIIEPVVRDVVYVPYYNTRVVYGNWWWNDHPPVYWRDHHRHDHVVSWGPKVRISGHFVFSAFRWDHRHLVVIDRDHRHRYRFTSVHKVADHHHARHWRHRPHHKRSRYDDPRTRDYFRSRKHDDRHHDSRPQRAIYRDKRDVHRDDRVRDRRDKVIHASPERHRDTRHRAERKSHFDKRDRHRQRDNRRQDNRRQEKAQRHRATDRVKDESFQGKVIRPKSFQKDHTPDRAGNRRGGKKSHLKARRGKKE